MLLAGLLYHIFGLFRSNLHNTCEVETRRPDADTRYGSGPRPLSFIHV